MSEGSGQPGEDRPPRTAGVQSEILRALDEADLGIVAVSESGDRPRVLYANPAARDLLRVDPDDDLSARLPEDGEAEVAGPGDASRFLDVWSCHVDLGDGPTRVRCLRDISDRKATERALRDSEERFRAAVLKSPDGVTILRGTTILFTNPAAAFLLGSAKPATSRKRAQRNA